MNARVANAGEECAAVPQARAWCALQGGCKQDVEELLVVGCQWAAPNNR